MVTLHFTIHIKAASEKVWNILWQDATYRQWVSIFAEGSHAISDWKEGSRILFVGPSGDGMYSEIVLMQTPEFMSFRHLGVMKEGKEQPSDEDSLKWSGAMENYTLLADQGGTTLTVDINVIDDFQSYFEEHFPLALQKVKEIAEN